MCLGKYKGLFLDRPHNASRIRWKVFCISRGGGLSSPYFHARVSRRNWNHGRIHKKIIPAKDGIHVFVNKKDALDKCNCFFERVLAKIKVSGFLYAGSFGYREIKKRKRSPYSYYYYEYKECKSETWRKYRIISLSQPHVKTESLKSKFLLLK